MNCVIKTISKSTEKRIRKFLYTVYIIKYTNGTNVYREIYNNRSNLILITMHLFYNINYNLSLKAMIVINKKKYYSDIITAKIWFYPRYTIIERFRFSRAKFKPMFSKNIQPSRLKKNLSLLIRVFNCILKKKCRKLLSIIKSSTWMPNYILMLIIMLLFRKKSLRELKFFTQYFFTYTSTTLRKRERLSLLKNFTTGYSYKEGETRN